MAIHLYTAPAGAGKTEACVDWVRAAGRERPLAPVWACLPNRAQVAAFHGRLAARGGALGVEAGTFFDLYRETLQSAGWVSAELPQPLQHRLLRMVIDEAAEAGELQHYLPLRDKPGFVRALHGLVEELKQARIEPTRLRRAVQGQGRRLEELAGLYAAYQGWLLDEHWLDAEGLGWLAVLALERNPTLFSHWALLAVDGFDQLNLTQVAILRELARQVPDVVVTMTYGPQPGRLAHRRFEQALARLEEALQVRAEPLPAAPPRSAAALAHLEAYLFEPATPTEQTGEALAFLEAPNRAEEVRAVLRWAKERLVRDEVPAHEVAILARDLAAYAPLLLETAEEYGIPLNLPEGLPLAWNPAVAALMAALSLPRRDMRSASVEDGRFPLRQTLEALRSPYFDWSHVEVSGQALGLGPEDVDCLEQAAESGQVLAGLDPWREAFELRLQAARAVADEDRGEAGLGAGPAAVPPQEWAQLQARFERIVGRLTPPGEDTVSSYAAFVEDLIGDEPGPVCGSEAQDRTSLRLLANVCAGPPAVRERDLAALRRLKDALRGLVRADAVLGTGEPVPYERFLDELQGVVEGSRYAWTDPRSTAAVWAGSAHDARGLSFRAVAILGLSEGEFPRPAPMDPLLREDDRLGLAERGLPLEPPPVGSEFTLFYEAVTRARERLLLSRPYLSDDGQPWEPSPFWEDVVRLFGGDEEAARKRLVTRVRSSDHLPLDRAASWTELVTALSQQLRAGEPGAAGVAAALRQDGALGWLWRSVEQGAGVVAARLRRTPAGPFEGDCTSLVGAMARHYSPERIWSASRLESYLGCPLAFYLGYSLRLELREPVAAGFDPAQLGSMYHEILERVYQEARGGELQALLAALPRVADEVLSEAPHAYGFRPSLLWEQEKARIREDIENTLRALAEEGEEWEPYRFELAFGRQGDPLPAQTVPVEEGVGLCLRGIIDRVDRNQAGELRLIDYKSTSQAISYRDLFEGHRIQLALYGWAAAQMLGAPVVDGFYWHIRAAKRSSLTLEGLDGGARQAMEVAAARAWEVIEGVRAGRFLPQPDREGCPGYCPGSPFCWRYSEQR